jgi:hypothetical protein
MMRRHCTDFDGEAKLGVSLVELGSNTSLVIHIDCAAKLNASSSYYDPSTEDYTQDPYHHHNLRTHLCQIFMIPRRCFRFVPLTR